MKNQQEQDPRQRGYEDGSAAAFSGYCLPERELQRESRRLFPRDRRAQEAYLDGYADALLDAGVI